MFGFPRFLSRVILLTLLTSPTFAELFAESGNSPGQTKQATSVAIRVRVAPVDLHGRKQDDCPAEFRLTTADLPPGMRMDLSTLTVVRVDAAAATGAAAGTARPNEKSLPLRWYDDVVPYDFPEAEQNIHSTDGLHQTFESRPRWGDYYNLSGGGRGGRLVWLHTQHGKEPSDYEIRCRVVDASISRTLAENANLGRAPRGFIGDGSHRCAPIADSSTDMIHSRVTVTDFNGDGLPDLLIGGARGAVLAYPNAGTRTKPDFPAAHLIQTSNGKPLDVGWSAAPLAVDWDGDGQTDLLCGAERNRILFYRNAGKLTASAGESSPSGTASQSQLGHASQLNQLPRFDLKGFVKADGQPIVLPTSPVPEGGGIFTMDYYPVLDAVDWNGDARRDLLAGGFITGRIYLYEATGRNPDGTPQLKFRDAIQADGQPLDVGWAAAPCAADFDGDGDLDLICGCMPMSASGGDQSSKTLFLRYYENVGTRTAPRLVSRPFPRSGEFPDSMMATPRAVDLNGDGLLDLVVSASTNVYVYLNVGTKTRPQFAVNATPLPNRWGGAALPTFRVQFLDVDGDGKQDILTGLSVYRSTSARDAVERTFSPSSLLPPGNNIDHPARSGDGWMFTQLADLDGDGRRDLLYGTHAGEIYLHHNQGLRFDEPGVLLRLVDGKPLHVGPEPGQALDFDVLQGSRIAFAAADFDGDGRIDLAVGDTYGKLRYFRNVGTRTQPVFAKPVELGDMKIRMVPCASDWDGDGRPDIIGSAASGSVALFRNLGGNRFAPAEPMAIPPTAYSPTVTVTDWNGDGDDDLIVGTAYGFFCWFERSFLERGYAKAERIPSR